MITLILMFSCGLFTMIHKLSNFNPSDKITYKRYFINSVSEKVAWILGLMVIIVMIANIVKIA